MPVQAVFCVSKYIRPRELVDIYFALLVLAKGVLEYVPQPAGNAKFDVGQVLQCGQALAEIDVFAVKLVETIDEEAELARNLSLRRHGFQDRTEFWKRPWRLTFLLVCLPTGSAGDAMRRNTFSGRSFNPRPCQ
jgi:hypothetical protein